MFWRRKSPLDPDDEAWQVECWQWLLRHFGGAAFLQSRRLILPTRDFFTPSNSGGHAAATHYFRQVAAYLDVDPALFVLVQQEKGVDPVLGPMQVVTNAPRDPAGTFSLPDDSTMTISYDPSLLAKPAWLIATLAHEICHPLLFSIAEEPPGGPDMEEFATDLAVTVFGFGIFNANTAVAFTQFSDSATGTQGWSFQGQGYLSPAERAFALALFVCNRDEDKRAARTYLDAGPLAYFDKAVSYIEKNPSVASCLADAG